MRERCELIKCRRSRGRGRSEGEAEVQGRVSGDEIRI